jgi:transposase
MTGRELLVELNQRGIEVGYYAVWHFLDHVSALKKSLHASEQDRADMARRRRRWKQHQNKVLVPDLRPGDVVIMDNVSSHKNKAVRRAIRAVGAKLFYLPPYSPDLNPIEQAFSRLKTLLRKENARTVERHRTGTGALSGPSVLVYIKEPEAG